MIANATFPAVGETQCHVGQVNGCWQTWYTHGRVDGKHHFHNDRTQAFSVHDANVDVLKFKMGKIK